MNLKDVMRFLELFNEDRFNAFVEDALIAAKEGREPHDKELAMLALGEENYDKIYKDCQD